MRKRKIKRYNGEEESVVELSEVEEPEIETRRLDARPDVEGMKRELRIAAGTPTDRPTARELQSFKAAEIRMPAKKPKPKPRYSGVVKASELGSQDFSSKATPAKKSEDSGSSKAAMAAGLGLAAAAGAGAAKYAMDKKSEAGKDSLAQRVKEREGKKLSGSTVGKMPGSSLSDPYSMNLGSDLDPKRMMRGSKRMGSDSRDTEFKTGGKVSKASSRADGIAQRGKTRGRIC